MLLLLLQSNYIITICLHSSSIDFLTSLFFTVELFSLFSFLFFFLFFSGHKMSEMPLEPQLAKMLLISPEFNCSNEVKKKYTTLNSFCNTIPTPLRISTSIVLIFFLLFFRFCLSSVFSSLCLHSLPNSFDFEYVCTVDALYSGHVVFCFHLHETKRGSKSGKSSQVTCPTLPRLISCVFYYTRL